MSFFGIRSWWRMRDCPHPEHRLQCIHGDRINHVGGKRSICLDCYRYRKELPAYCMSASISAGHPVFHRSSGKLQDNYDDE